MECGHYDRNHLIEEKRTGRGCNDQNHLAMTEITQNKWDMVVVTEIT